MKFDIRKKLVTLAVASAVSGGAMMMAAPAHAMNVSQNNVGQVLLFPYYTVKNGFDTLFSVTNTSDKTAVFKIRWREARNSRETLDFNVILSPFDVWNGVVTAGTDGGAVVRTWDKTCTSPRLPGMVANADRAAAGAKGEVAFSTARFTGNAAISGTFNDNGGSTIDRVQEGYFEVILMGVSGLPTSTASSTNTLEYNAKHVGGVPRDCAVVDDLFLDLANFSHMTAPENILKGHVTYINVASGKAIDAEPTAIEDFRTVGNIVAFPGDLAPDLTSGDALTTINLLDDGTAVPLLVAGSQHAVTNLLQATSVINEYATGGGNTSTSWVVTFPTKHHYTDAYSLDFGTETGTAGAPFSQWFSTSGKSCDNVGFTIYNREEATEVSIDTTKFSPYNPSTSNFELCYEANVIDFNGTNVFGTDSTYHATLDTSGVGSSGWVRMSFTEGPAATVGRNGFLGLPVIGFSAIVRDGTDATVNYGSATEHTTVRGRTF